MNIFSVVTEIGVQFVFAYDTYGNRLISTTDALGKTTTYSYNADTNILEWVQYPEDTAATRTHYTYDGMYRMETAAVTTNTGLNLSAAYTYTDDYLTKIETASTAYDFSYGDFGLRTAVKIGSRTLASYSYTSRNNYLSSLDYGNGDSVQYTYDQQGRVTQQTYEDGDTVSYKYDNSGALACVTDSATGRTTTYYYDFTDRLMKYVETGSGYSHSARYEYDTINNLTRLVETINGVTTETAYTYDDDNRVTGITSGTTGRTYSYDGYGRVSQWVTKNGSSTILTDTFTFRNPTASTTSTQIAAMDIAAAGYSKTYSYTYDDNGNITSISDGTSSVSYEYDTANQLVRENNQAANKTTTWTYDNAGNILQRKEYAYTTAENPGTPTDTVNYSYNDSAWGDLLTAYDGSTITYDEIGTPLTDGTWTYTWQHGRELASMTGNGVTWNYTYDSNGMRTGRTNGTTTYSYVYYGGRLSQMTVGSDTLRFAYDASGTPMAVTYNGTAYYYVTNLHGDVIAILNSSGTTVVGYTYDAWGNPLTVTGSLATTLGTLNPLRYRGYVYDTETGLYYLQSRYYNPEIGRFINADVALFSTKLLGNNLFSYCECSPVSCADYCGFGKTYVIYYENPGSGFEKQAYNSTAYDSEDNEVIFIGVTTVEDFINAWNSMEGDIDDVFLYLHGGSGKLYFKGATMTYEGDYTFDKLENKSVNGYVFLFSCKGGKGKEGRNVAWTLAEKTNAKVRACTGGVSYTKICGKYYARKSFKDYGAFYTFYYDKGNALCPAVVAKRKAEMVLR